MVQIELNQVLYIFDTRNLITQKCNIFQCSIFCSLIKYEIGSKGVYFTNLFHATASISHELLCTDFMLTVHDYVSSVCFLILGGRIFEENALRDHPRSISFWVPIGTVALDPISIRTEQHQNSIRTNNSIRTEQHQNRRSQRKKLKHKFNNFNQQFSISHKMH